MREEAIGNLRDRLSSPRLRPPTTIKTYLETAERFLNMVRDEEQPTDSDLRHYFMGRRAHGISERCLRKEFFHLKKLFLSNQWPWPFTKDDTPYSDEEPQAPALPPADIEKLIATREKLSRTDKFYLAVATTWIVRREELSRIKKRDYDTESFTIHTAKRGRKVTHLIPEQLSPIFGRFRAKAHTPAALSLMFQRICKVAGVKLKPRSGWHSIRRTLTTLTIAALVKEGFDPALVADYGGWSKKTLGSFFGGAAMVGVYRMPEIIYTDKYGIDRVIYSVHPFLNLWQEKPNKKRASKKQVG